MPSKRLTAFLVLSTVSCEVPETSLPTEGNIPVLTASVATTTVTLTNQDFESTPLGGEPYPYIAETWCPNSFVGASTDIAQSGSKSFRYFHGCEPGVSPTGTSLSFALCTRWPTRAVVTYSRRFEEDYGDGATTIFSGLKHEPATGIAFNGDGRIRLFYSGDALPHVVLGTYLLGQWVRVETDWDFVAETVTVRINGILIGTYPILITKPYWLGTFATTAGTTFYDDDARVDLELRGERQNCDGTEALPWPWPPPEGQQGGD